MDRDQHLVDQLTRILREARTPCPSCLDELRRIHPARYEELMRELTAGQRRKPSTFTDASGNSAEITDAERDVLEKSG